MDSLLLESGGNFVLWILKCVSSARYQQLIKILNVKKVKKDMEKRGKKLIIGMFVVATVLV